jgi:hypothetical protein
VASPARRKRRCPSEQDGPGLQELVAHSVSSAFTKRMNWGSTRGSIAMQRKRNRACCGIFCSLHFPYEQEAALHANQLQGRSGLYFNSASTTQRKKRLNGLPNWTARKRASGFEIACAGCAERNYKLKGRKFLCSLASPRSRILALRFSELRAYRRRATAFCCTSHRSLLKSDDPPP